MKLPIHRVLVGFMMLFSGAAAWAVSVTETHTISKVNAGAFALSGNRVLMEVDGWFGIYDHSSGGQTAKLRRAPVNGLKWAALDGVRAVVSIQQEGKTYLYNSGNGRLIHELTGRHGESIFGRVGIQGRHIVVATQEGAYMIDRDTGLFVRELFWPSGNPLRNFQRPNYPISFHGGQFLVGQTLFDVATGDYIRRFHPARTSEVGARFGVWVALHPDFAIIGERCSTPDCTQNVAAVFFDRASGKELYEIGFGADGGEVVAVDGDYALVSGPGFSSSADGGVALVNVAVGQIVHMFARNDVSPGPDYFGSRIGISENRIVILGKNAKRAYFYTFEVGTPNATITDQTVCEGDGSAHINVGLSGPAPEEVTVTLAVRPGSAKPGSDYASAGGTISIPKGEQMGVFEIPLVEDAEVERSETLEVEITAVTGASIYNATATLTIQDNDWVKFFREQSGVSRLAVSGDRFLVAQNVQGDLGLVTLRDVKTGELISNIIHGGVALDDEYGHALAMSDRYLLIGAPGDDKQGDDAGAAYGFDAQSLQPIFTLVGEGAHSEARFGSALSVFGQFVLVGAPGDDELGDRSGSAHLYGLEDDVELRILPEDGAAGDRFGAAVSIDGEVLAIGAPRDDDLGPSSGAVYLFDRDTGKQQNKLTAPDGAGGNEFGHSVHVNGDIVAVGAPQHAGGGAVYLFRASDGSFVRKISPEEEGERRFGYSLEIDGLLIAIGVPSYDGEEREQGAIAVHRLSGERVTLLSNSHGGDLGWDVAFDGPALLGTALRGSRLNGFGLPLSESTVPPAQLVKVGRVGGNLFVELRGRAGQEYLEETSSDLQEWRETGNSLVASGGVDRQLLEIGEAATLFVRYRAKEVP